MDYQTNGLLVSAARRIVSIDIISPEKVRNQNNPNLQMDQQCQNTLFHNSICSNIICYHSHGIEKYNKWHSPKKDILGKMWVL